MKNSWLIGLALLAACTGSTVPSNSTLEAAETTTSTTTEESVDSSESPEVPDSPISQETEDAVSALVLNLFTTSWDVESVWDAVEAGDPRVGWIIADLLRFYQGGPPRDELVSAFSELTDAPSEPATVDFVWASNFMISKDIPAWDGYPEAKRRVFGLLTPRWNDFFAEDRFVDWRHVTWGGVLPDERPLGDNGPCNCIPALDYPATTDAGGGDWYDDERVVFGVVVNNQALALPKNQMEVHEMVNLSLGGRELGIPYCTLCGSAQAYFVDDIDGVDRVVLRTSGLLQRSNKLMYDLTTGSAIDTFTGRALTGPLAEADVVLEQVSVVASTWGDWRTAHPDTQILAEDGGIGRTYADDPLRGRDDGGPIFPVGDVDPRLPIQEPVVGIFAPDGTPVAFPVEATRQALQEGEVEYMGLTVRLEDGLRVYDAGGAELISHQAFWFAWSQFHPATALWTGD